MKNVMRWICLALLMAVLPVSAQHVGGKSNTPMGKKPADKGPPGAFCWRDTYGRGAGTIPGDCSGKENDAGLCYSACKAGYKAAGPVCWGHCPSGFSDHGVGCTKPAPYGRGGGYPWKFGDGLNNNGMMSRCSSANPGGCEMDGAIAYPKCKAGFHKVGCCICSPDCPSGFGDTGATCVKPSYGRGAGTIPGGCGSGKQNDAGLCYSNCKSGFSGVGPVCWGNCPANMPINCGAGCASTVAACSGQVMEQVLSVVEVAATIAAAVATGGGSAAATTAAKASAKAAAVNTTKAASKGITKTAAKQAIRTAAKDTGVAMTESQLEQAASAASGEDWDPYSLDPTGIASIVKAYNQKKCSG